MYPDQEINALSNVYEAVKGLNNPQIKRIIDWVASKFCLDIKTKFKASQSRVDQVLQVVPIETVERIGEPVKEIPGRPPVSTQPISIEPGIRPLNSTGKYDFMNYSTFKDLVSSAEVKTIAAKILLASAYLHEKRNLKEFATYDINALLKKIGQRVNNISASINSLMMKRRPLLVQTGKLGTGKRSKRTFSITEEGLRLARSYLER